MRRPHRSSFSCFSSSDGMLEVRVPVELGELLVHLHLEPELGATGAAVLQRGAAG